MHAFGGRGEASWPYAGGSQSSCGAVRRGELFQVPLRHQTDVRLPPFSMAGPDRDVKGLGQSVALEVVAVGYALDRHRGRCSYPNLDVVAAHCEEDHTDI